MELKFTSENGNCNKCFKFQLLSTHVYLTYFAFYILHCVLLGFNLSENPRWTTFLKTHVRIHLFTVKKDWMILSGVAGKVNWTDKLLHCIHNKTSHPWMVDDRYKMCYSMPTYCYNTVKHAKSAGCIKSMPLTTWVTCFRCTLQFFLSITIHISWEIVFKTSNKYQFPREARRFLRIQQWCL